MLTRLQLIFPGSKVTGPHQVVLLECDDGAMVTLVSSKTGPEKDCYNLKCQEFSLQLQQQDGLVIKCDICNILQKKLYEVTFLRNI